MTDAELYQSAMDIDEHYVNDPEVRHLAAYVARLEAALKSLLHNMQQHNCAGCHIEKAREALRGDA